jgi:hypothetical protein
MRAPMITTLVALMGLGGGCATVSVKTDFDPAVDFSQFRSFQVIGGVLMVDGRPDTRNTLVIDRIKEAIVQELAQRGMQLVENGGDLAVAFVAGARTVTEIEGVGPYRPGFGPYWGAVGWWGPGYYDWWTRTYTKGTLIIDLMDAKTSKLVWRAYAEADINSPDAKEFVRKTVHKAFEKYPPPHK